MRKKIMRGMLLLTLGALVLFALAMAFLLYDVFSDNFISQIRDRLSYVTAAMEQAADREALLREVGAADPDVRVTWIMADGTVLFDSHAGTATMENHLTRPEIHQALAGGLGHSQRHSATLGQTTYYYAAQLTDGTVMRLSGTRTSVFALLLSLAGLMTFLYLVVSSLSIWAAGRITNSVVRPLNQLDLDHPLENEVPEELSPLLGRLEKANRCIDRQLQELAARQNQLDAIMGHMAEGLVVVGLDLSILMINRSAARLFGAEGQKPGSHVLTLSRDMAVKRAMDMALNGTPAVEPMALNGRFYQLLASPVEHEGQRAGALMMILDVTDRHLAEQSRRAFSANVSHELKTPLTSILGYAEIMCGGMAGEADMRTFSGRIHEEAARLLTLIDDIIHLSRLDEQLDAAPLERIDLCALLHEAAQRHMPEAEKLGVSIDVSGTCAIIEGERATLEEMVFNLLDNALKYNVPGGSVEMSAQMDGGTAQLTVRDTGIGIPQAEHERVFERFYRVDKSRSKAVGGTGLGLSIVKHAAVRHGATVALRSAPGQGTTVTVRFPT